MPGRLSSPINLEQDDDVFNYPWLYAVEVGHWELTDQMVAKFREFLDRGGFFMCDDFHGTKEWEVFVHSMKKVIPRPRDRRHPARRRHQSHGVRHQ